MTPCPNCGRPGPSFPAILEGTKTSVTWGGEEMTPTVQRCSACYRLSR
jgi:hypothetical protein